MFTALLAFLWDFVIREADQPPADPGPPPTGQRAVVVTVRDGRIAGVGDSAERRNLAHVTVAPEERLGTVLRALERTGARAALVMKSRDSSSPRDLVGVITDREVVSATRSIAHLMQ